MQLYLVRHGEQKNVGFHLSSDEQLSSDGLRQAKMVANRFRELPVDVILSSNYTRAQQTAEEIGKILHKKIFYTDLLVEWKIPSGLIGKNVNDPEAVELKEMLRKNAKLEDWHVSDEENFTDFKKRALKFFEYLEMFKEEHILIISHASTLRMLMGLILFKNSLTADMFYEIDSFFKTSNTGITICNKDDNNNWKLITWNDHAHLG